MAERPTLLTLRANALAKEEGAEAVVIITLKPDGTGRGWNMEHSLFCSTRKGLTWETVIDAIHTAAEDFTTRPLLEVEEPS